MKFDCDKARDKELAKREWHAIFAWWPRRVGPNDCRWLETIERRLVHVPHWDGLWTTAEYRVPRPADETAPLWP